MLGDFMTCRKFGLGESLVHQLKSVATKQSRFWLGRSLALPFSLCPLSHTNLNAQLATPNSQPTQQALACFEFIATHLKWVVKAFANRYLPIATVFRLGKALLS